MPTRVKKTQAKPSNQASEEVHVLQSDEWGNGRPTRMSGNARSQRTKYLPEIVALTPLRSPIRNTIAIEADDDIESDADEEMTRTNEDAASEENSTLNEEDTEFRHKRVRQLLPAVQPVRKPISLSLAGKNGTRKKGLKAETAGKRKNIGGRTNGKSIPDSVENSLYDTLFDEETALEGVIAEWITSFEKNEIHAMLEMVNLVLKCCGCAYQVQEDDIEDEDNITDALATIQELYKKSAPHDYPLISKKPQFRRFDKSLRDFFNRLLQQLSDRNMLTEENSVLDRLQQWVSAMSSSAFRPFRHTATAISLWIITSLCDVYAWISKENATSTRQLETEKKKARPAQGRVADLDSKLIEQGVRLDSLNTLMTNTFDSVFVHRYRDVDAKIRTECIHELSQWMVKLPSIFFEGSYLRYMGWVLSDMNAGTRLEVVKSLTKLYSDDDHIGNLRHFTDRFQQRLIQMATEDADRSVRITTLGLLELIRERGFLEDSEIELLNQQIFDLDPKVRKAVAPFFYATVQELYEETIESWGKSKAMVEDELGDDKENTDGVRISWLKFNALGNVLSRYDQLSENADIQQGQPQSDETSKSLKSELRSADYTPRNLLAASALMDVMEELQDWEGLATYLLRDHTTKPSDRARGANNIIAKARKACALNPGEDVVLLQVLNASIERAAELEEAEKTKSTATRKRKRSNTAVSGKSVSTSDLSTSLVRILPQLITRFGSKPETASAVLRIVQHLSLDKYNELRQTDALEALLEDVGKQFLKHTNEDVFREASASLLYVQKFENLIHVTEGKVNELEDEVTATFVATVESKDLNAVHFTTDHLNDLTTAVSRLDNLCSVADCTRAIDEGNQLKGTAFPLLVQLLRRAVTMYDAEESHLMLHTISSVKLYFMWKVNALCDPIYLFDTEAINTLRKKRDIVVEELGQIINDRPLDEVKVQAAGLLIDLYTLSTKVDHLIKGRQEAPQIFTDFKFEIPAYFLVNIHSIFEDEIKLSTEPAKRHSRITEGGDSEFESEGDEDVQIDDLDLPPEAKGVVHERRLCDLAARLTVGIIAGSVPKSFAQSLQIHKGLLGTSYDKIIRQLGEFNKENALKDTHNVVVDGHLGQAPIVQDDDGF